ncbi:MAG TPA: tRNA (adenine-N1)-methyltransferase [Acidimicrobiales bacterium]|nr:tRNA (adenine-N1)-methyltransferase [Acidimicrobiales bacterium]
MEVIDMGEMLEPGEQVLFVDNKKRRYLVTLETGGEFHSHAGIINHDDLIGGPEGASLKSSRGSPFVIFRPTLSDFILKMPRGAQVIYPKDLGPLLLLADIYPGAKVFESGVGSGALSMTMLRSGADITGYDIREDFVERARRNVEVMLGVEATGRYKVEVRDTYDGIDLAHMDRVVLDLPEPWQVVPHAALALRTGGIIVAYTPSIVQAVKFREALSAHSFDFAETIEVLNRSWHIDGQAVRPDHRMVAHTGFLSHARLLGP